MRKDIIAMSKKELKRLAVVHKVMDRRLTQVKAAEMLGLRDRQVRRIIRGIEAGGDQAIIHGSRGKESPFKMSKEIEDVIVATVERRYYDFGPTFAAEKLFECEKIKVSNEKLRQIMISHGIDYPRRKKERKTHSWRERKHCRGEMVQMDGSDHDWLEGRGPRLIFMGYIDDASGEVFGRFYDHEGTYPAMDSLRRYINIYGIPSSIYVDRHSTYKTTRQPNLEEALKGEFAKTQVARSLGELNIEPIFALSPQAKGRIERAFKTLQDRLVKELRLASISTLKQANNFLECYLPKHNARFMVQPFRKTNLHRPVPKCMNFNNVFCIKEHRTISNGFTCQWKNRIFLIKNPSITMKKQRVCVMERFNGEINLKLKDKDLPFVEVTRKDIQAINRCQKAARKLIMKERIYYPPPKNHPWRKFTVSRKGNLICA